MFERRRRIGRRLQVVEAGEQESAQSGTPAQASAFWAMAWVRAAPPSRPRAAGIIVAAGPCGERRRPAAIIHQVFQESRGSAPANGTCFASR